MVGFDKFNGLLQHEFNRKEFLRYLAIALLSLIGVASMLQNLNGTVHTTVQKDSKSSGYGASVYGR